MWFTAVAQGSAAGWRASLPLFHGMCLAFIHDGIMIGPKTTVLQTEQEGRQPRNELASFCMKGEMRPVN